MENVSHLPEPLGSNCTYVYGEADCIGFRGFGLVFKATVTDSGDYIGEKTIAVKKIRFEIQNAKPSLSKAEDVPEILKKWEKLLHLRHENVISIYKVTCTYLDSRMASMEIMMDYMPGDLRGTITACKKRGEKLALETALEYALQLAKGLDYLHKARIVHADIKPANILVKRHSGPRTDCQTGDILKIGDLDNFIQLQQTFTCSMDVNHLLGSVRYMSPEMLRKFYAMSADIVGRKTDLWSLGCVLHELFDCGFGIDDQWLCKNTELLRITDVNSTSMALKILDGYIPFISNSIPENLSAVLHSCLAPAVNSRIGSSSLIGELQKCMLAVADTALTVKHETEENLDHVRSNENEETAATEFPCITPAGIDPGCDLMSGRFSHGVSEDQDCITEIMPEIKIVMVGAFAGKTALIWAYNDNKFTETFGYSTVFDLCLRTIEVGTEKYRLNLWDISGLDDYSRVRPLSYHRTDVFLICHAVDHIFTSVTHAKMWVDEIHHFCPGTPFILVVTKTDLREDPYTLEKLEKLGRKPLSTQQGKKMAVTIGAHSYLECSARNLEGLTNVFEEAVRTALLNQEHLKKKAKKPKKMCRLM